LYEALPGADGLPISRLFHPEAIPASPATKTRIVNISAFFIVLPFQKIVDLT
jgi:hypothetical protein